MKRVKDCKDVLYLYTEIFLFYCSDNQKTLKYEDDIEFVTEFPCLLGPLYRQIVDGQMNRMVDWQTQLGKLIDWQMCGKIYKQIGRFVDMDNKVGRQVVSYQIGRLVDISSQVDRQVALDIS